MGKTKDAITAKRAQESTPSPMPQQVVADKITPVEQQTAPGEEAAPATPPATTSSATPTANVAPAAQTEVKTADSKVPTVERPTVPHVKTAEELQQEQPQTIDTQPTQLTYGQIYDKLKQIGDEEIEKERKRARSRQILAAIGDGVSAIANMYYTSKGALNTHTPNIESMGKKNYDRWKEFEKELQTRRDKNISDRIKMMQLDEQNKRYVDELAYKRELDNKNFQLKENADRRADLKAERDAAKAELDRDYMLGKISQQEALAKKADIDAQYAKDINEANIANKKSSTARNYSTANKNNNGGGSSKYYGTITTEDGDQEYKTSADYKKRVYAEAERLNIPTKETITTYETWDTEHKFPKEITRNVPIEKLASQIEAKTKQSQSNGNTSGKNAAKTKSDGPGWGKSGSNEKKDDKETDW